MRGSKGGIDHGPYHARALWLGRHQRHGRRQKRSGPRQKFSEYPLLKPALQFVAAWSYQRFLIGAYGPIDQAKPELCAESTLQLADTELMHRLDIMRRQGFEWTHDEPTRDVFRNALTVAFEAFRDG